MPPPPPRQVHPLRAQRVKTGRTGAAGGSQSNTRSGRSKRRSATRKRRITQYIIGFVRYVIVGILSGIKAIFAFVGRVLWAFGWRTGVVLGLCFALATLYFYSQLPPVTALLDARVRGSVTFLDNQGHVFAWRGESFNKQISLDHVSPNLQNAIIATEDKRFYHHFGISPRGILGAIRINLRAGRGPFSGNGGSTITQQIAKLLCLGVSYDPEQWPSEAAYEKECRQGGIWRKIKELPFAIALELKYSKSDILTIYLNRAYLGAGTRGFEAAARRYFGKSANDLSPAEAAMLAGLLTAPSRYAPTSNLERAQNRANIVIGLMEDQGYITPAQAQEAREHPAQLSDAAKDQAGGAFADWVMDEIPTFLSSQTTEDVLINTTLDTRIQKNLESAIQTIFDTKVRQSSQAQVAAIVMSADGAVRAMYGGRGNNFAGAFNRAVQAKRQSGSSFKPFAYAAALDMGYRPWDMISDSPLTIYIPGSGPWTPRNYDNQFEGIITLTQALSESRNIPTVRLSESIGRDAVRQVAQGFGLSSDLAEGPALVLGASETTLLRMTGAYAGILNGGNSVTPYGVTELHLRGDKAPLMSVQSGIGERIISQNAAQALIYMLFEAVETGTGRRARLNGIEVAGKTGTTQSARDAWFIGFTADYVIGVWMGNDDNAPLSGVTGGGLPADIWHGISQSLYQNSPRHPLPMGPWRALLTPGVLDGESRENGRLIGDDVGQTTTNTPYGPAGEPLPPRDENTGLRGIISRILRGLSSE